MNLPISSWAIRNPIPVVVAFTLLMVAGLYSYTRLPVKQFPNIAFPMVVATIIQEGAAPTELENQVTRIVENSIASLPDIEMLQSSVTMGASTTIIQFKIGTNLQKAKDDVEQRVNQVRNQLPASIQPPLVNSLDFTGGALMTFAVSHPTMSEAELSWFIDDRIARDLQSVRGVGQVSRVGGVNREINITLDPVRMNAIGVTAADVNNALQRTYRNYGGGVSQVGGSEIITRVIGETATVEELANLSIPLRGGQTYVRLSDVAEVGDGSAEIRSFARLNGRPVVGFDIIKVDTASEVDVENGAYDAIARLKAANPGLEITKIFSITDDTKANFHATQDVLIEGMILAALVVFLFLRDWRATVIAALAMPLSLIPTFWIISLLGFSLNVVTLLALTLVIGILVDDAIVEVENIQKRTLAGYTPFRAAMEGADAIGLAVLATTASIVVVFLPTSFMGGMPGQFFIEFGITVAVAVVFSLLVARFVSPLMAAYFLKPSKQHMDARKLPRFYEKALGWSLKHRLGASAIGGAAVLGAMFSAASLPSGFIPTEDPGYIMFNISAPPGSTREQMEKSAAELSDLLKRQPDTKDVFVSIGSGGAGGQAAAANGGGGGAGMTSGSAILVMTDHHKMHTEELKQHIRPQLAQIPDIRVTALMSGGGPTGSDVNILLTSEDAAALDKAQVALLNEMKDLDDVIRNPRLSPDPPGPELIIRPRAAEAARLNVSTDAIAQVARIATSGDIEANTPKFSEGERRLAIRVRLPEEVRRDLAQLAQLRVPTLNGGSTTLGAVADISYEAGPGVIQRMYRQRMAAVQADFAPGVTSGEATAAVDSTPTMAAIFKAEAEGNAVVSRARVGQEQAMNEMFSGIIVALLSGIALIYSVMVLLFKSVFKPLVIMFSLPLSFTGAFVALLIFGKAIDMPVMIGLVLLLGISAKNAILLVEFAIESEQRGNRVFDALFDACRERARPIVMTTVAMSAGMLPTALGLGEGAGFRTSMAIAVIGGLFSSTVLSLVLVPVIYSLISSIERRVNPLFGRLVTKRTSEDNALLSTGEDASQHPVTPTRPAE